ncbi:putative ABC transporter permease protein [Sphingobium sp. SYK-6]|uniref:ABC transporter permease n=1 Tax=Sphingobium sp. (strain NBRC 103272 / SYK-6) TaxID=627192 RepID=UPI0002277544|nr:FtsX-like permease family protein [Sphingobium sp. SYK-6]BAK66088.1 putative ABC transporter permease protein [Sphingobium sp. SYK-6]
MIRLAFAYLRDRPLMTALNVLLLAFAVATLVILLSVSTQLGSRFERDARGIDLVVGAKGSPLQLILSSIYHIDAPTGNIPLDSVDLLRADPSVRQVIPLALGDNFRGYRIVGTEVAYVDHFGAKLAEGRMFTAPQQVVIGAGVARALGMKLGQRFVGSHGLEADEGAGEHEHSPFTTVGILAPTGSVIDRLILTSVESVWDVHGIAHHHHDDEAGEHHDHEAEAHHEHEPNLTGREALKPEVTALLVSYKSAFGAVRLPIMINRQTNMQAAVPAIETARLLSLLGVGIDGARAFAWLLAATGGLSIFVALLAAATAREGDLALLRIMGASPWQVFGTILAEGLIIAAAGAMAGFVLGHAALALATRMLPQLGDFGFDPFALPPGEGSIVLAVLAIGLVAALIPGLRVFRTDLVRTLARTS